MASTDIKWVDKYRPTYIDDMILSDELKTYFKNILKSKKYVNCSLIASPGIGKTTLAKALAASANAEVLFMSCASGDGKVEAIQTKLIPFTQSLPLDDQPLFVILDEIDSASSSNESSFQKALRNVIENAPNVTFICTANFKNKVLPAVLSRCPEINLTYSPKDVLGRLKVILDSENIKYSTDDLKEFIKTSIKKLYPDIRAIINSLQACCSTGELIITETGVSQEKVDLLTNIIDHCRNDKSVLDIRKFYQGQKDKIDDVKVLAGDLFNYVVDNGTLTSTGTRENDFILSLADIYYRLNTVVDPEIQFFAMIVLLHQALHLT